jgi:hypothetical protein
MFRWLKKLVVVAAIVPIGVAPAIGAACCGSGVRYDNVGKEATDSVTTVSMTMDVKDEGSGLDIPTISVPGVAGGSGASEQRVF